MYKFIKKWFLLILGLVSNQLFLFLIHVSASRTLSLEEFGYLNIILILVAIGSILTQSGTFQIITREIARETSLFNLFSRKLWLYFLISCLISSSLIAGYIFLFESYLSKYIIFLTVFLSIGMFLWGYFESFLFGLQKFHLSYIINIIIPVPFYITYKIYNLNNFTPSRYLEILVSFFIGKSLIIGFFYLKNLFVQKKYVEKFYFSKLYKPASKMFLIQITSFPLTYFPVLFLGMNYGKYEVGIFAASNKISLVFNLVITSLTQIIFPRFSKLFAEDFHKYKKEAEFVLDILIMAGIFITLSFCFFSREVILFVWGSKFEKTIEIFNIQIWSNFFAIILILQGTISYAANLEKGILKYAIINSISILFLSYFSSFYGAKFVVISLGIVYFISLMLVYNFLINKNILKKNVSEKLYLILLIITFITVSYLTVEYPLIERVFYYFVSVLIYSFFVFIKQKNVITYLLKIINKKKN